MAKWIQRDSDIYIAPEIKGMYRNGVYSALDERTGEELNPRNIDDKIFIYERQVKDWFFNRADDLIGRENVSFIIFMIALSYIEGVEQYRTGQSSRGDSSGFFVRSFLRIYPQFTEVQILRLYGAARCGLFHNGMVSRQIILSDGYPDSVEFPNDDTIKINHVMFLKDIETDFEEYLNDLRNEANIDIRRNFHIMYMNC